MNKKKISAILIAIGVTLSLTACGSTSSASTNTTKKTVSKATSNAIDASGTVEASNVENISLNFESGAAPTVTKINVQQGQVVKKGDKLLTLDMTGFNDTIQSKQKLIDADVDTKSTLQDDKQKKIQQDKIDSEQADLNAIKSEISVNHISGSSIVSDLDNAVVTAVTGDSSSASASTSTTMSSGLVSLADLNSLYIKAEVSEDFINSVSVGKAVTITPTSDTSAKLTGKVTSIGSTALEDKNGDTYIPVSISIDQNNGKLFPNYNVDVEISK